MHSEDIEYSGRGRTFIEHLLCQTILLTSFKYAVSFNPSPLHCAGMEISFRNSK